MKIDNDEFLKFGFHNGGVLSIRESIDFCKDFKLPIATCECTEYWQDGLRLYYFERINTMFMTHYHHGEMIAYFKPENIDEIIDQLRRNKYIINLSSNEKAN